MQFSISTDRRADYIQHLIDIARNRAVADKCTVTVLIPDSEPFIDDELASQS